MNASNLSRTVIWTFLSYFLDIWQHGSCAIGQYKEPIDLSRLIVLRNITLCIKLGKKDEPDFYINHFWWVNKLLRACSSHNERLQKITVEVAYDYWIRPIDISHWEEIVDALLGHHFTRLKQLDVLIVPPTKADDAKEVIVALQTSGYIERLRSRRPEGLEVNLRDMTLLRGKPSCKSWMHWFLKFLYLYFSTVYFLSKSKLVVCGGCRRMVLESVRFGGSVLGLSL